MTHRSFELAKAKGEFGEKIVRSILEQKGFVVYQPVTDKAHAFDVLAIKDKTRCLAMDVKAKSRRNNYEDTGICEGHYQIYRNFSSVHNMPFWVIFVDEMTEQIYGNTLDALDQPKAINGVTYPMIWMPRHGKPTRFWPLANMRILKQLQQDEVDLLKSMNQRTYEFNPAL